MKFWNVIECCLGTDGVPTANAYPCHTEQEAGKCAENLIATICDDMDIDYVEGVWDVEGDGWSFSVRIQEEEI